MSLTIRVGNEKGRDPVTVEVSGRLDASAAPQLGSALEPLLERRPRALVLDLSGLDYISSDGLGIVLGTRKRLEAGGARLLLMNLRPHIEKVFRVIKAIPDGGLFRDRSELDAYLEAIQRQAKRPSE